MSREIDAFILIASANSMSEAALPGYRDIIENDMRCLATGVDIDRAPAEKLELLLAADIFVRLGGIVMTSYAGIDYESEAAPNPFLEAVVEHIDTMSPIEGEGLLEHYDDSMSLASHLEAYLEGFIDQDADAIRELYAKLDVVKETRDARGVVEIPMLNPTQAMQQIKRHNKVPEAVVFDNDGNVVSETFAVRDVVNLDAVERSIVRKPYYESFNIVNAPKLLDSAVEDLYTIATTIARM